MGACTHHLSSRLALEARRLGPVRHAPFTPPHHRCLARDNPAAARRMMERLLRRGPRYRALDEGPYVIVYRIEPGRGRVVIVAALHVSRDIRRIPGIPDT